MVDAVHPRRDDDGVQSLLHLDRQFQVAVVEDDGHEEHLLPQAQRFAIDAEQQHLERAETGCHRQLAEMKPHTGRRIEIEIDVMHRVEAPEEWRVMIQPVPEVQRVVEEQESKGDPQRARHRNLPQQSQPSPLG